MLAAAIIVFREAIEAGLIIGIVMAVTRNVPGRSQWIVGGVVSGLAGAGLVAAFAGTLSNAVAGTGTELFNATVLGLAVCMLAWHNIWMARHGRKMATQLRAVGEAVVGGSRSLAALAIVVGIAVLREGSEVVLFLYGIAVSDGSGGLSLLAGGLLGLMLGGSLSLLTYLGLVQIPPRLIFGVTSALITFLAAGMASQCVSFLAQAGIVTALGNTAWNTSWLLSETSIPGKVFHTLFGYSEQPSFMQLIAYLATLAVIFTATR
ncbi:MAG: FTR1 family protein, partial [Hyphomicrobiales bacterium]|nr:FTR1 family protein [Hyphomicrobiales bacterium]